MPNGPLCPAGTVHTPYGECVPPRADCPPGTVRDAAGLCHAPPGGRCPAGSVRTASGVCVPPVETCPAGTARDAKGLCRTIALCPRDMVEAAGGGCVDRPPDPIAASPRPTRAARAGELLLTPRLIGAGGAVTASGAGCTPFAEVVITSDGEQVGRTFADASGHFTAPVRFGTFRAGPRKVAASCGPTLTTTLDMVLARSTGGASRTYVLLLFFLLVAFLLVRSQYQAAGPRR
jgi:hypothetical protein